MPESVEALMHQWSSKVKRARGRLFVRAPEQGIQYCVGAMEREKPKSV